MKTALACRLLAWGLLFGAMAFAAGCPWLCGTTVKIGALLPLTGSAVDIGVQERNAFDLALQHVNWCSEVRFEIVYEDTRSDAALALSSYDAAMAAAPNQVACLSSLSRISEIVVPEANDAGVPVLAVATSMPGITDTRPWAFRMHSTSAQEAQAMAQYWLDNTVIRRVAFFYINDAMGHGARDTFVATFTGGDAQVVWDGSYEQTDTDFAALIGEALAAEPDGVYVMGFVSAAVGLVVQLQEALTAAPLPVGSNLGMATPEFIAQAGDAYEDLYFTTLPFMFDKDVPGTAAYEFAQAYRAAYDAEPDIYGALAYDTMGMIAEAAGDRRVNRDTFRTRFGAIAGYAGAMGTLSMDANRELVLPVGVAQMHDGALNPVS